MNILFGVYSGMVLGASSFVIGTALGQNPIVFMTGFASATILSTIFFGWLAFRGYVSVVMSCSEMFGRFFDISSLLTFIRAFNSIMERELQPVQPPRRVPAIRVRRRVPVPEEHVVDDRAEDPVNAEVNFEEHVEHAHAHEQDEIVMPVFLVARANDILSDVPEDLEINGEGSHSEEEHVPDAIIGDEDN